MTSLSTVKCRSSRQSGRVAIGRSAASSAAGSTSSAARVRRKEKELLDCHPRQRLLELRALVAEHIARINALLSVESRASARMAQIVAFVYQMRQCQGIVFLQTPQEAQSAVNILRQAGLDVSFQSERTDPANTQNANVLVRVSDANVERRPDRLRYILHATPPRSLTSYFADLAAARKTTPPPTSTILYPRDGGRDASDIDSYCRLRTCRYAHLARRLRPTLIKPEPHLFTCGWCDICISYPFGINEEEHGQVVSV